MDKPTLQSLINDRFGSVARVTEIEKMPWFRDKNTKFTWKDHLIRVSKRRLRNCVEQDGTRSTRSELTKFIDRIEKLERDTDLCYFTAESDTLWFSGWTIGEEIGFCIPKERIKK